jgi:Domain of Unknown Function (DUF928)
MNKVRLKSIVFGSILLIGAFNACQFASLAELTPRVNGLPGQTVPGGPRFSQPPEDIDVPTRSSKNNVRGGCPSSELNPISLTALAPENHFGRTVSEYPTFFFYLPPTEAESAEFILVDESGKEIYKQTLKIKNLSGVIGISIPSDKSVAPLEVDKRYKWNFTVICDAKDRSGDQQEMGTVLRVELSADIRSQLEKADQRNKTFIYAKNGIWQDALSNLAAARRAQPDEAWIKSDWESLLDSVKLGKITKEPIVQNDPKP